MKRTWIIVSFLAAVVALAQLTKYKDWPKSPEAYFLTPEERSEWSKIQSDEEAEKFIATYWAKRGGQKFKDEITRRISAADEQFKLRRQRGSQSVRGRMLITLGGPSRVTTSRAEASSETGQPPAPGSTFGQEAFVQTWIYEKDKFDPAWGIGEIRARVLVDPLRGIDELQGASATEKAITKVAEKSIVNPAPAAPGSPAGPGASAGAPAAASAPSAPPAPAVAALPAAARATLESVLKEPKDSSGAAFWGGSFRSVAGEPFYAMQFSLSADRVPAGAIKFGGTVMSESGQEVASFWEDATLSDAKTGSRADKVFERSVILPGGAYRAAFGFFPPDAPSALASATARFRLESKAGDFEVSPLILANTVTPLGKRPGPADPFVFGMEKPVHVAPKANRLFAKEESLWYFYTVTNPKLLGPAATTPAPAGQSAPSGPTPGPQPAAESVKPRVMARIGVLRNGQPAFAPFTGPAELQPLGPAYYAAGSEIPLATFQPGYYTFTLNVRDLNAPKDSAASKGVDLKGDFVVLKPDGSLPEKQVPTPSAKPKPPSKKG